MKTDKQIKEEFISDGIGNFEKDVNYLISLIEDFLKTGEVNKETASFKKFFNLFKILKLTAHHKDHTGLISKGDESEDMINFKETEKFLEGCLDTDNALYNIETAPYMVSLTV